MTAASNIRIGCSGWQYADWKCAFYPSGLPTSQWLEYYATQFDTVEVNATFYRLPKVETVRQWVERTPEPFTFAIKGSKFITQNKKLKDFGEHVGNIYSRIEPLRRSPQMGPVLWQLPERFRRNDERLAQALGALPPGEHTFEFRHPSWFCDEVYELLRTHGVALTIGDHPERKYQTRELTASFTFVRFHFSHENASGNYSHAELERWADWLRRLKRGTRAWVYFNNDWQAFAIENARFLRGILGVPAPPDAA